MFTLRFASCLLAAALFALALPASAQRAQVLRTWEDPVKLADGTETVYRYEVSYDYESGVALRRAYDPAGTLVETLETAPPAAPLPPELDEARAILQADPEIGALTERSGATVEGGFILFGAQHPACARPARCLQFDIMAPDRIESLQFVVVDLRTRAVVERDLFPDL